MIRLDIDRILEELRSCTGAVAIDTETTGLALHQGDRVRGLSLAYGDQAFYVPLTHPHSENVQHPDAAGAVVEAVHGCAVVFAHNGQFDWTALGVDPPGNWIDTMTLSWMQSEASPHGLKAIGSRMFGVNAAEEQAALRRLMRGHPQAELYRARREQVQREEPAAESRAWAAAEAQASRRTWATLRATEIAPYAAQDAWLTLRIGAAYMRDIVANKGGRCDVLPDLDRQMEIAEMIHRLGRTGVRVDPHTAALQLTAAEKRLEALAAELGPNLSSPAEVAKLVYDEWGLPCKYQTGTGQRSVAKEALDALSWHPQVQLLLEHRQVQKAVTSYYRPLLNLVGRDGRLHPSWSAFRTVTGRLSCSAPNVMTIPRDGGPLAGVRDVFTAEPGMSLWSWDMSQAEIRAAASISQDPLMLRAFAEGQDLYAAIAAEMQVSRQAGKTALLAFQYGARAPTLSRTLARGTGQPPDIAAATQLLRRLGTTVPRLVRVADALAEQATLQGYVALHQPGRFRHYDEPYPRYYTALNALAQGGVAELAKSWMLGAEPELEPLGARIVAQVHDSLVIELPDEPGLPEKIGSVLQSLLDDLMYPGWVQIPLQGKPGV